MHKNQLNDMSERLNRLERSNKRLRFGLAAAALAVGATGLMSANAVCKEIWGEVFVLRDGSGHERVTWDAYHQTKPTLTFKNQRGQALATMAFDDKGEMNLQVRKDGKLRPAYLSLMDEKPAAKKDSCTSSCSKSSKSSEKSNIN